MGQYHKVVNLDRREFIHPHQLGDGLKLWEQAASGPGGTASALLALLAVSNGRGGGDFDDNELIGSWGGNRIVVIGDYAESTDLPPEFEAESIYGRCSDHDDECDLPKDQHFRNITADVRDMLAKNLGMVYSGDRGWLDRKFDDGSEPGKALKPDMVIYHR